MKQQTKIKCRRWFALFVCLCVFFLSNTSYVFAAVTEGTTGHTADDDTRGTYTTYLNDKTSGELTTEFSGRVWADKTVTTDDQKFSGDVGNAITVQNDSDFLVTYSALATTQSVTGEAQSPLDVVFVVDFSGSMINYAMDNRQSRLANLLDALNSSIKTLMEANEYNRVAVVCYSGKPDESVSASKVLLPLNHYSSSKTYFSINDRTATTLERTVSWNIDGVSGNHTVQQPHATNTQMGLYTGMNLLKTSSDTTVEINGQTVQRVPAVIHLSDGNPTVSSDSQNWWEPSNNSGNGNGVVRISSVGNGLKAMMTATYMKREINRNYNADSNSDYAVRVYNIGMGLDGIFNEVKASLNWNTDIDANKSQNLAYVSLDPGSHWNDNNNIAQNFRDNWNQYKKGSNITIPVSEPAASARPGDWTIWWENTFPSENYTVTHPSQNDITEVNDLNYVDQYFAANNASAVMDVFEQIVSDITMSTPQVPTNVSPDAIDKSGYITYTDEIGDYMEVKDVKNLIFSGTNFTKPSKTTNGNTTTYTFSGQIDSPVYGKQNADDIAITVTSNTDNTGKMTQTLTVKIPASAIPLRVNTVELDSSGNVKSHKTNNAYPVRLCYTVGVQDGVKNADGTVDLSKIDDAYKQANTGTDGLYFYSNKYTGDIKWEDKETAGNAYVEFTPAKNNPYFYVQESIPLYTDETCNTPVTQQPTSDDGKTYYYQVQYYSGMKSVTETRSVTGIKGATELINGQWCVKAGEMNAPHVDTKHAEKTTNNTSTAQLYYYAHMNSENAQIHLGNNGRLAVKTASLAVEKDIEVPEGIDAGHQEFSFTVTLKDTDSHLVSGTFSTRHVVDDGNGSEASVENGRTSLNFIDGTATFELKPGEKLYIDGLVNGWSYTVSETDVPDDGFDQTTPADGDASGTLEDATTTVSFVNTYYPGSIAVTKRDGAGDPLEDAEFQLYKDNGTSGKQAVGSPVPTVPRIRQTIAEGAQGFDLEHMIFTDTDGKIYPVHTDGSGTKSYFYYRSLSAEEQEKYEQGTLTNYEEVAEFTNLLVNGTYYLKEATVPDGYSAPQTDDDGYLIVGENEQTKITVPTSDGENTVYHLLFTVTNHKNMILPTTGLSGIGRFLVAGVVLLTAAVVLWKLKGIKGKSVSTRVRRRRRRRR